MKQFIDKLVPKTVFGSIYALVSIVILVGITSVYIKNVNNALNMNKLSYECTQDGMMKNICDNPYGSSVFWTMLEVGVSVGPLIVVWIIMGLYVITLKHEEDSEIKNTLEGEK